MRWASERARARVIHGPFQNGFKPRGLSAPSHLLFVCAYGDADQTRQRCVSHLVTLWTSLSLSADGEFRNHTLATFTSWPPGARPTFPIAERKRETSIFCSRRSRVEYQKGLQLNLGHSLWWVLKFKLRVALENNCFSIDEWKYVKRADIGREMVSIKAEIRFGVGKWKMTSFPLLQMVAASFFTLCSKWIPSYSCKFKFRDNNDDLEHH